MMEYPRLHYKASKKNIQSPLLRQPASTLLTIHAYSKFSHIFLIIVLDRCSETSCSNHGVCQAIAGARYECVCEDGWNGDDCSNNIDECQNLPCLNGGLCKDHINSFICQCLGDWSGDVCGMLEVTEYHY